MDPKTMEPCTKYYLRSISSEELEKWIDEIDNSPENLLCTVKKIDLTNERATTRWEMAKARRRLAAIRRRMTAIRRRMPAVMSMRKGCCLWNSCKVKMFMRKTGALMRKMKAERKTMTDKRCSLTKTTRSLMALKHMEHGNEAYKKKIFPEALLYYNKASKLDCTEMTYMNKIAAVYFEQKDYYKCIKQCLNAMIVGRENNANVTLLADAFTRIAKAYLKLGDLRSAKTLFKKTISRYDCKKLYKSLSKVEKKIKKKERLAYIHSVKAEEEKEKGKKFYLEGDYATAIEHYKEAIKRNPDSPKFYSNRAACYTKLAAFDLGLKDYEQCVKLDPKFIEGWIQMGKLLQGVQQHGKALRAYQRALELDSTNTEAIEGCNSCSMAVNSNPAEVKTQAMTDAEIQAIVRDPVIQLGLKEIQNNPTALQNLLKNPDIAVNIQKLLDCGIIAIH